MNVLILAAGDSHVDTKDAFPLCLAEFNGVPLIERLITGCKELEAKFIVAMQDDDIRKYHLDNVVRLLAPGARVLYIRQQTAGAACTALLGCQYIDNDEELLILNGNEILEKDFAEILENFRSRELDAGVVIFRSVHPRYSYVRLGKDDLVVEAAEKNPISQSATVGFYWFRRGSVFVKAAKGMIRKDASVNGVFYVCPALNELVLEHCRIGVYPIEATKYHPLKSERQILHYEVTGDQGQTNAARQTR